MHDTRLARALRAVASFASWHRRAVGALLAALSVLLLAEALTTPPPTQSVVVLQRAVPAGEALAAADVSLAALPPPAVPDGALASTQDAVGQTLAVPVAAQDRLPPAPYAYQQLRDPAQEAKAKELMETLRCLVCQGQSIADSDAPLAGDMRHEVRTKIAAGESPDAIRKWLVARYGNWVTYDPPLDAATALLWFGPLLFLALGGWLAFGRFRRSDGDGESEI